MIRIPTSEKTAAENAIQQAIRAIPPLWPLTHSVAVNPFLGQAHLPFAQAAATLARISGERLTLPRAWYLDKARSGEITDEDLKAALLECGLAADATILDRIMSGSTAEPADQHIQAALHTLARDCSGLEWGELIEDRFGAWASAYFDEGQALWPMTSGKGAWSSWLNWAQHDLTPEISGLTGFGKRVQALPEDPETFILQACNDLKVPSDRLGDYFHQLLLGLGG